MTLMIIAMASAASVIGTTAASSCLELLQANPGLTNGDYHILVNGTTHLVFCDMEGGGWTRVVNVLGSTPQSSYVTAAEVSVGDSNINIQFNKLSDADINWIHNGDDFLRYRCGPMTAYITNPNRAWSSLRDTQAWELDRNLDGIMDCQADRPGYTFADYPDMPLAGATSDCNTEYHTNYGETSQVQGCFYSEGGWGAGSAGGWSQPATIWVRGIPRIGLEVAPPPCNQEAAQRYNTLALGQRPSAIGCTWEDLCSVTENTSECPSAGDTFDWCQGTPFFQFFDAPKSDSLCSTRGVVIVGDMCYTCQ